MEESIPFSGEIEMQGSFAQMIPVTGLKLVHRELAEKPDYDGEMRELSVDAVIELDVRLYGEQEFNLLADLYATNRELVLDTADAVFDRILTRNLGKCKVTEKTRIENEPRVLQICHSSGSVKLDSVESKENALAIEGVLEVKLLYLTDDDARPVQAVTRMVPFHYEAEVPGIREDSIWYLEPGLEQLTAVMAGGGQAELGSDPAGFVCTAAGSGAGDPACPDPPGRYGKNEGNAGDHRLYRAAGRYPVGCGKTLSYDRGVYPCGKRDTGSRDQSWRLPDPGKRNLNDICAARKQK